jgi:hypothetical protein
MGKTKTAETAESKLDKGAAVGRKLRLIMSDRGLNTHGLWEVLKKQGANLSERHLEDLVRGRVGNPRDATLGKIAQALSMTLGELFGSRLEVVLVLTGLNADVVRAVAARDEMDTNEVVMRAILEACELYKTNNALMDAVNAIQNSRQH